MENLKIVIIAPEILPIPPIRGGAVETWVDEFIKRAGSSFELSCFSIYDSQLPISEKKGNVTHYRFKPGLITRLLTCTYKLPFKRESSFLHWLPYSLWCSWKISRIKPQVIHLHNRIQFVPAIRFFNPKAKIILHIHQLSVLTPQRLWNKKVISKIDMVVTCSRFLFEEVRKLGVAECKLTYIYNGFDQKKFVPFWQDAEEKTIIRKQLNIINSEKVFLYVGRIAENKGVHLLIDAFKELLKKHNNIRLVVAGGPVGGDRNSEHYFQRMQSAVEKEKGRIVLVGKISHDDINKFYLSADIVVVPSIVKEGLPLVILETMACGIPPIVSNRGGLAEVIENGKTGLVVNNIENAQELAGAMEKLIQDERLRQSLGRNAYEFVKDRFSWEEVAKNTQNLYEQVIRQKNILIYEASSGYGGSAKALVDLVDNIDKSRFKPVIVTRNDGPQLERLKGIEVIRLRSHPDTQGVSFFGFLAYFIKYVFPESFRLYRLIKQERISLVHINNNIISAFSVIIAARLANIPCLCHIRQTRSLLRSEKLFVKWVDKFILINKAAFETYKKDIPLGKLTHIYDGVNLSEFTNIEKNGFRKELSLDSEPLVGLVGRIVEGKGHKEFVLSAKEVIKHYPMVKFVVVGEAKGESDTYYKEVRELVKNEHLEKSIIFTGWRDDVKNIISNLDILVQATTTFPEGFGLTCTEAMALGKPVIATNIPGPSEIVVDEETGYVVPKGDIHALADKITHLLHSPDLSKTMGLKGRSRVEALFDIKKNIVDLEKVYSIALKLDN